MSLRCFQRRALVNSVPDARCATRNCVPQASASRRKPTTARAPRATNSTVARFATAPRNDEEAASSPSTSSASAASAALAASFFNQGDDRPILLYDARCNLCNGGVDVARAMDKKGDAARLRFAALQSPAGRALLVSAAGRDADDISSVVFVESADVAFVRSEAVVRAARAIGAPPALLAAALAGPVPLKARDSAYDAVADSRYSLFGKSGEERWTREGEAEGRFLVE